LPLSAILPAFDLGALILATSLGGRHDEMGFAYVAVAFVVLLVTGQQRAPISPRISTDLPMLFGCLVLPVLIVAPLAASDSDLGDFVRMLPITIVTVVALRFLAYRLIREARARGLVVERTVIVGAGVQGARLATTILKHPEFGLQPVGFVDSFDDEGLPLPILGPVEAIESIIAEYGVRRLVIAFGGTQEPQLIRTLRALDPLPVEVHIVPRFFEYGGMSVGRQVDDLWGIPVVRLRRSALRSAAWHAKIAIDMVAASLLLCLASPVMAVCAAGVRLSSPGPILFRQKRVGQHGQIFELLKFRSMRENDGSETSWSGTAEDLMTGFGRLMRRTGIDELPQLFNVLRREMSLVGPRPERPHFADQFSIEVNGYEDRHRVPVGITGWAQVHGLRGDSSIANRAVFDNNYIEHWSLWRDFVILARTVITVFRGEGR
jgi:exopolysaccharide biosynthesis polyprenyl glycosylphosphotransferase